MSYRMKFGTSDSTSKIIEEINPSEILARRTYTILLNVESLIFCKQQHYMTNYHFFLIRKGT